MSTSVEDVVEEVRALPLHQRDKMLVGLLSFLALALLVRKTPKIVEKALSLTPDEMHRLRDELNNMTWEMSDPDMRQRSVRAIRGKYASLPTGSESFAARKAEVIGLEDRGSRA